MSEVIPIGSDHAGFEMKERVKAERVRGEAVRGVLPCGTGLGMPDANVLMLPAPFLSDEASITILRAWLDTGFAGGRHTRRVAKIDQEAG